MGTLNSKEVFTCTAITELADGTDLAERARIALETSLVKAFVEFSGFDRWNRVRLLDDGVVLVEEDGEGVPNIKEVISLRGIKRSLRSVGVNGPQLNFLNPLIKKLIVCMANGRLPSQQKFLPPHEVYAIERDACGVHESITSEMLHLRGVILPWKSII